MFIATAMTNKVIKTVAVTLLLLSSSFPSFLDGMLVEEFEEHTTCIVKTLDKNNCMGRDFGKLTELSHLVF